MSPCTPNPHVDPGTDTRGPTHIPNDTVRPDPPARRQTRAHEPQEKASGELMHIPVRTLTYIPKHGNIIL